MTNEEAIKILKENRETYQAFINQGYEDNEDNEDIKRVLLALDMAIEALEKQIPKKPERIEGTLFGKERYYHKCPNCGDPYVDDNYCPICGQARGAAEDARCCQRNDRGKICGTEKVNKCYRKADR